MKLDEPYYYSEPEKMVGQTITGAVLVGDDDELLCLTFKSGHRAVFRAAPDYVDGAEIGMGTLGDVPLRDRHRAGWITDEKLKVLLEAREARDAAVQRERRMQQYLRLKKEFDPE